MTTTKIYQGMEPGSKSSSRVLRPPGGGSNISFGTDEEQTASRKNKMASSIFAEPEDPHAFRRNNPPGGKPTGVLCGESSAPLRRGQNQNPGQDGTAEENSPEVFDRERDTMNAEITQEPEPQEPREEREVTATTTEAAGVPSGRRNPPGGKSSLILG